MIMPFCKDCDHPFPSFVDKHLPPIPCIFAVQNGIDPHKCTVLCEPKYVEERSARCAPCKVKLREQRVAMEKAEMQ